VRFALFFVSKNLSHACGRPIGRSFEPATAVGGQIEAQKARPRPWARHSGVVSASHGRGGLIRESFGTATAVGGRFERRLGRPRPWAADSGVVESGHGRGGGVGPPFELPTGAGRDLAPTSEVGAVCTPWF